LDKLKGIAQSVVKNGTIIAEVRDDVKELKDGQDWLMGKVGRLEMMLSAKEYHLEETTKRIGRLERKLRIRP